MMDNKVLNPEITLRQAQATINSWIQNSGKGYFSELTNMAILAEEVGEVARLISRTYGEQTFKESERDHNLADELADVLWVVCALANQTGVDLTDALKKNLDKKLIRDANRHSDPQ